MISTPRHQTAFGSGDGGPAARLHLARANLVAHFAALHQSGLDIDGVGLGLLGSPPAARTPASKPSRSSSWPVLWLLKIRSLVEALLAQGSRAVLANRALCSPLLLSKWSSFGKITASCPCPSLSAAEIARLNARTTPFWPVRSSFRKSSSIWSRSRRVARWRSSAPWWCAKSPI